MDALSAHYQWEYVQINPSKYQNRGLYTQVIPPAREKPMCKRVYLWILASARIHPPWAGKPVGYARTPSVGLRPEEG